MSNAQDDAFLKKAAKAEEKRRRAEEFRKVRTKEGLGAAQVMGAGNDAYAP